MMEVVGTFQFSMLNYWMFEMLFFELFNSKFLKTKIYRQHIFSLIFIIFFCSLFQTITIILNFSYDTVDAKIFKERNWLIVLGIIINLLINFLKAYLYCNEKYYLEKKVISITGYLFLFGLFGIILSSICIIISTFVPCGDNNLPEFSKEICNYKDENNNYYFDSYILYFKELAKEYLGLKIFLVILYTILMYGSYYYCYAIYKVLNPIYHICMYRFNFLIVEILKFINDLVNDKIEGINITINILDILIIFFYLLGSIVYLEFIELNFCKFNYYTKRNIKQRAIRESRFSLESIMSDIEEEK